MIMAVFAVTDEGDEGAVPLIDMTKVTRSTPADQPLPHPRNEAVQRRLKPGSCTINPASGGTQSGNKNHGKGQKWNAQHAKAAWGGGKLFGFSLERARPP